MSLKHGIIISKLDYVERLISEVMAAHSNDVITIVSMTFDPQEPLVQRLVDELIRTSSRGVHVRLLIDAYGFLIGNHNLPGPLFWGSRLDSLASPHQSLILKTLERLRSSGVQCGITNTPAHRFSNPFANRSHVKFAVIGGSVYLGGCNLDDPSIIDIMIRVKDRAIATYLNAYATRKLFQPDISEELQLDQQLTVAEQTQLLHDMGAPTHSLILDAAFEVIDQAQTNLLLLSMFPPTGQVVERLKAAADRGVDVEVVCNSPAVHGFPYSFYHRWLAQHWPAATPNLVLTQLPHSAPLLHAKFLSSEKCVIIGSHNFMGLGVRFGTEEIALRSGSILFVQNTTARIRQLLDEGGFYDSERHTRNNRHNQPHAVDRARSKAHRSFRR